MDCGSDKTKNPEEILLLDILEGEEYPGSLPLDAGEERYIKELTRYYLRNVSGNEVDYTTVVKAPTLPSQRPSFPGAIRTLVRSRDYLKFHNDSPDESDDQENAADSVEDLSGAFESVKLEPLTQYDAISDVQWKFFFYLTTNTSMSVSAAAKQAAIKDQTARDKHKAFLSNGCTVIPQTRQRGPKPKLTEEHVQFFFELIERDVSMTLKKCARELESQHGVKVDATTIYRSISKKMNHKKLILEAAARNSPSTKAKRVEFANSLNVNGIDYLANCVFIDEAAFNTNLRPTKSWFWKGQPRKLKTPSTRALNYSMLGAICGKGIALIGVRDPNTKVPEYLLDADLEHEKVTKKRKRDDGTMQNCPKLVKTAGTTAVHFFEYLNNLMDVLDTDLERKYTTLVMDNARFHHVDVIKSLISRRGYKVLYLPPYSPELNPIECFWALLKSRVRSTDNNSGVSFESLSKKVEDIAFSIDKSAIKNMIMHSVHQLDACQAEIDI